jgi:hypothetical protein
MGFLFVCGYSLVYGAGALLERHIGDFQILLTKDHSPRTLFGGSWGEEGDGLDPIPHLAAQPVGSAAAR